MSIVVFKLGGSLLDLPDLAHRLRQLLNFYQQSQSVAAFYPLIVVGGGRIADVIRDWDRVHHLGNVTAHELAMSTLAVNESLVAELLADSSRVRSRVEAESAWLAEKVPILQTAEFIASEEKSATISPLPKNWDVTSDSLAAWIAATWPADRLVLLKSTELPREKSLAECVRDELVDRYFPELTLLLPHVDWVNLRGKMPVAESEYSSTVNFQTHWMR